MRHFVYEIVNPVEKIGRYSHFIDLPDDAPAPPNSTLFEPKLNEHVDTYWHLVGWRFGPKLASITDEMVWRGFLARTAVEVDELIRQATGGEHHAVVQQWPIIAAECEKILSTDTHGQHTSDMIFEMAHADGRGMLTKNYAKEFMDKYYVYRIKLAKIIGSRDALIRKTDVADIPRITLEMLIM